MKPTILLPILLLLIVGCAPDAPSGLSGTQDLALTGQDLQQLGMLAVTDCTTEEYQVSEYSPLSQYTVCTYAIDHANDTEVIIELKRIANASDLEGAYQYDSSHYFSIEGLLSEDTFGDKSRFRVNNENDYGGEFNPPGIYFYHLWIVKDDYLIHITSKGVEQDEERIAAIGHRILAKFE